MEAAAQRGHRRAVEQVDDAVLGGAGDVRGARPGDGGRGVVDADHPRIVGGEVPGLRTAAAADVDERQVGSEVRREEGEVRGGGVLRGAVAWSGSRVAREIEPVALPLLEK